MSDYMEGSGVQYHIRVKKGDVGRYCILPGDPGRVEAIAKYLECAKKIASNREFVTYTGSLLGKKVSVVSTGIGGPSAAICLEELVKCGADTFIRVGTAGGINVDVKAGDLVVASAAVRAEGTAREYVGVEYPAVSDFGLTYQLLSSGRELCKETAVDCHVGVVQCKDSFYGQHEPEKMPVGYRLLEKWDEYCKMGCLASEMESATLFIVGQFLRVRCATVLSIVGNQEREKRNLSNKFNHNTDLAIRVAVKTIENLIRDEE